jgi:hypothetical protein
MNTNYICPVCKNEMFRYDKVKRIKRTKKGAIEWIDIFRLRCAFCGIVRRDIPDTLIPFKHYESDIIFGMIDGTLSKNMLDYEDRPCEITVKRWKEWNSTR